MNQLSLFALVLGCVMAGMGQVFMSHEPEKVSLRQQKVYAMVVYVGLGLAILGAIGILLFAPMKD